MVDIPELKVGIISCSGEEIPEGTLSRVATRIVLEKLRPDKTVTICLPLFLAGGEEERTFANFFPTITVEGCEKLCARIGTEAHSGKTTDTVNVRELLKEWGESPPESRVKFTEKDFALAERIATVISDKVDKILEHYHHDQKEFFKEKWEGK